jgi:hypothetical protein
MVLICHDVIYHRPPVTSRKKSGECEGWSWLLSLQPEPLAIPLLVFSRAYARLGRRIREKSSNIG